MKGLRQIEKALERFAIEDEGYKYSTIKEVEIGGRTYKVEITLHNTSQRLAK